MGLPGPKGFNVSILICATFKLCLGDLQKQRGHRLTVIYKKRSYCLCVPVDFQGDAGKIGEAGSPGPPGQRASHFLLIEFKLNH